MLRRSSKNIAPSNYLQFAPMLCPYSAPAVNAFLYRICPLYLAFVTDPEHIYLPLSMCTAQLPPIPPTLCASPIFAPLICLFSASHLNWIAISHICETP